MTERRIIKALSFLGWATVISYPIRTLAEASIQHDFNQKHNIDDKIGSIHSFFSLFAFIFDSPAALSTGLFCFAAAHYLKKKPQTLKDIFE